MESPAKETDRYSELETQIISEDQKEKEEEILKNQETQMKEGDYTSYNKDVIMYEGGSSDEEQDDDQSESDVTSSSGGASESDAEEGVDPSEDQDGNSTATNNNNPAQQQKIVQAAQNINNNHQRSATTATANNGKNSQKIQNYNQKEEIKQSSLAQQKQQMRMAIPQQPQSRISSGDINLCYTDRLGAPGRSQLAYLGQNTRPQAWINQKNLQIKFLEQENSTLKQLIKDNEETIRINKDMMCLILADIQDVPDKEKQIMVKLQFENGKLFDKQKQLQKETDDIGANLLIQQQIIEDLKSKEDELNSLNDENIRTLQDKLEKKEYALQVCELKIYHYEKYLQRKALTETEGRTLLFKFQQDDPKEAPVKISNVVEDNMNLKQELKEAFQEVNRLQKQAQDLSERIIDLEDQLKQAQYENSNNINPQNSIKKQIEDQEMSIFDQTQISSAINNDGEVNLEKLKRMEKYFPQEYQNRLEILLLDMEKQVKALKKERKYLKSENTVLKESNDSNQFLITQLNLALQKANSRIKILEEKMGEHDVILAQQQQQININSQSSTPAGTPSNIMLANALKNAAFLQQQQKQGMAQIINVGNGKQQIVLPDGNILNIDEFDQKVLEQLAKNNGNLDPDQFGNLSSIMINPNEISNAMYASNVNPLQSVKGGGTQFNFAQEMELMEKLQGPNNGAI